MSATSQNSKKIIAVAGSKLAAATLISRFLGLGREQAMAYMFGASGVTDAFLVAYRIPNLLRDLFAEGAFSSAFIPSFTGERRKSHQQAKTLLWALFLLLLFITGVISLGIMVFAPELVSLMAPGFMQDPEKFDLTVVLTRMMAPFFTLVCIAALFVGALNTYKVFFIPALSPASFNLMMVLTLFILPPILVNYDYPPAYALGLGVLAGGIVQLLIQIPFLRQKDLGPIIPKVLFFTESKKVFMKLGPGLLGYAATQINLIVNTILASTAGIGAISWLSYGFRLFQFPVGVLGVSIANSNLVHFAELWKNGEKKQAKKALMASYELSWLLLLPSLIILFHSANPLVRLIFVHGRFSISDGLSTSMALKFYLLSLPFYGLIKIFTPTFYTLDQQRVPVICSVISVSFNIVFCYLLVGEYGFKVLALGTTLSTFINALFQGIVMKRSLGLDASFFLNIKLLKVFLANVCCYFILYWLKLFLPSEGSWALQFLALAGFMATGLLSYGLLLVILGEARAIKNPIKRK